VLFGEHVRRDPALSHSSFAEIAKETGKRWRGLSREERVYLWEAPAADKLQLYKEEMERYKHTEDYQNYQRYLEEFKQGRHSSVSIPSSRNKSSPVSESSSLSRPPTSQDQEEFEAIRQESVDTVDLNLEDLPQDTESPVQSGLQEVRHISKSLGVDPHLIGVTAFPQENTTSKAIEAFLHGTGSFLCLWNREEALDLVRSTYHPRSDSNPVYAIDVFAMSAVGSYCDGEAHTMFLNDNFLHFFVYLLSSPSDMCGLRYMRLFACLAICRITSSVESARRLMCN
jgi:hypothetical protein